VREAARAAGPVGDVRGTCPADVAAAHPCNESIARQGAPPDRWSARPPRGVRHRLRLRRV